MTPLEFLNNDPKNTVHRMLKIKSDRDPVYTAIEMLSDENEILEFLTDYVEWVKSKEEFNIDAIVYTVLKINKMLEKTDGVFKNYQIWKKIIGNTYMNNLQY